MCIRDSYYPVLLVRNSIRYNMKPLICKTPMKAIEHSAVSVQDNDILQDISNTYFGHCISKDKEAVGNHKGSIMMEIRKGGSERGRSLFINCSRKGTEYTADSTMKDCRLLKSSSKSYYRSETRSKLLMYSRSAERKVSGGKRFKARPAPRYISHRL
eukprot:TRINITY_DN4497_c0_g6_i1.p1 TRINITY_DN4497_c0_g6~~TRINITY_DN4497_c0_g6_i1.p1  ORF type:complete len:157 (+),score=20.24 TRINITY_DN4497_c0_g6_i1:83-553(+)